MEGGNNWQQVACLGALLAELRATLSPPLVGMKRMMDAGSTVKAGRRSPSGTPRKEVGMTDTSSEAGHSPKLVVTLFESYGSGGTYVSARVADALGVPVPVSYTHLTLPTILLV